MSTLCLVQVNKNECSKKKKVWEEDWFSILFTANQPEFETCDNFEMSLCKSIDANITVVASRLNLLFIPDTALSGSPGQTGPEEQLTFHQSGEKYARHRDTTWSVKSPDNIGKLKTDNFELAHQKLSSNRPSLPWWYKTTYSLQP